jgi:hypothetical protein
MMHLALYVLKYPLCPRTLGKTNRDKLFAGKVFYLTPSVKPSIAVLQNIVEFAGGRLAAS